MPSVAITSQIAHWFLFPQRVITTDVIENRWIQNKSHRLSTGFSYRFFDKASAFDAVGCRRHGYGVVGFVEREQSNDFYVNGIPVVMQKSSSPRSLTSSIFRQFEYGRLCQRGNIPFLNALMIGNALAIAQSNHLRTGDSY